MGRVWAGVGAAAEWTPLITVAKGGGRGGGSGQRALILKGAVRTVRNWGRRGGVTHATTRQRCGGRQWGGGAAEGAAH